MCKDHSCHDHSEPQHEHDGPHKCEHPDCGKTFSTKYNLKRHLMISHSSIKRYRCPVCQKTFALSQYLKEHLTIHTSNEDRRLIEAAMKGLPNIIRSYRQRLNSKQKSISTVNGHRNFDAEATESIFKIETNYYKKAKYFQDAPKEEYSSAASTCDDNSSAAASSDDEGHISIKSRHYGKAQKKGVTSLVVSSPTSVSKFNFRASKLNSLPMPLIASSENVSSAAASWSNATAFGGNFDQVFGTNKATPQIINCVLPVPQAMETDAPRTERAEPDLIADMVARFDFNEFLQSGIRSS